MQRASEMGVGGILWVRRPPSAGGAPIRGRRPARRAGRRPKTSLHPEGFSFHYKLFWAVVSAQRALTTAVRLRPPAGRAQPALLHTKKALT